MAKNMSRDVSFDWEPNASEAKDVRDTKMLDVTTHETIDEAPNVQKQDRVSGGRPSGPFGMHK